MKKVAVLIIDGQFDFCDPKGALFVTNADKDMEKLGNFITKNSNEINFIGLTMDAHQVNDISHPSFWINKDKQHPNPFTIITPKDVLEGIWAPRFHPTLVVEYINELTKQGEFPHCIWPEHCIIGSQGASFVDSIMNPIKTWTKNSGIPFHVIAKGTNPLTEHFGAFRANVPIEGKPETQFNHNLIKTLSQFDVIYFAGEARSHCVANTLKQAMEYPDLAKKFIVLTDCMSNVGGFEHIADTIYSDAKTMGVSFELSTNIKL